MKRKILALGTMAIAMAGMAQTAPVVVKNTGEQTTKNVVALKKIKQQKEIGFDGSGGLDIQPFSLHLTPKEYGQWLQANGKQKWTKKIKKNIRNSERATAYHSKIW